MSYFNVEKSGVEIFCFHTNLDNIDDTTLSTEERDRASRFYFERDRRRHIVCRSTLRRLLGERLGIPPSDVVFESGAYGKPRISNASPGIDFNLSHSGEMAAVAITRGAPVGIDIEKVRPMPHLLDIAQHYFSPHETAWLLQQSSDAQVIGFFRLWTLKEAILKADGRGLSFPLSEIEIRFTRDGPKLTGGDWRLSELSLAPGYTAAMAV